MADRQIETPVILLIRLNLSDWSELMLPPLSYNCQWILLLSMLNLYPASKNLSLNHSTETMTFLKANLKSCCPQLRQCSWYDMTWHVTHKWQSSWYMTWHVAHNAVDMTSSKRYKVTKLFRWTASKLCKVIAMIYTKHHNLMFMLEKYVANSATHHNADYCTTFFPL